MAVDLANATSRAGHRVTMCVTRSDATLASELDPAIPVVRLQRQSRYDLAPVLRLLRFVRRERFDVIHVHMRSSMALALPFRATRVIPMPVVLHDHYGSIERDRSVPRWFRIGHRWIDFYVGVSPRLGDWARDSGLPDSRVEVIENGLDLARLVTDRPTPIREELGLRADTRIGLIVASLRRDKGFEVAIEALSRARAASSVHLVVAGTHADVPYLESLRARAAELQVADRVHFIGPRRDVPGLLAACDFAISASHTESGPLVLVEFAHAGKPFVATEVGDIGRRLASAGVSGFCPPGDASAMAHEIDALLALSVGERELRLLQAREVLPAFDIRTAVPRWIAIYERARTHA